MELTGQYAELGGAPILPEGDLANLDPQELQVPEGFTLPPLGPFDPSNPQEIKVAYAPDYLLQFFAWGHLPPHLQPLSQVFGELAAHLVVVLPSNPERTTALRKLLEAKDCAVRARLFKTAD